ncbi:MAG: sodium:alanine symporter family protein [Parachlamydiaceae bacterium]|nr:sodium:alanine symporter family protein [Parachlamydiaceae bacterium]
MDDLNHYLSEIRNFVWGAPLMALLIGTGAYLTFILRGVQFRYLGYAIVQVFAKQKKNSEGDISHFNSLMTSLAGALGTGTIVGVATAVAVGGLGSLFWMWVTAFVGMSTKYSESLLAVKYRVMDESGEMLGGPMQYMERGLNWKFVAIIFAFFGALAAIGTGNLVQVNAITETMGNIWGTDPLWTGICLSLIVGAVLLGGVKSIGRVAGILVPFMAFFYLAAGLFILFKHYDRLPEAFGLIFSSAFSGQAAAGGFMGTTVMRAMQEGVARSIFSNEAGMGISSIAAAAAKTDAAPRQALIAMTGSLLSTVIVCTVTGLVIAVTSVQGQISPDGQVLNGASMAIAAFNSTITGGNYIVSIGLILFAFTTVIAWGYYGEKCFEYLLGERSTLFYRLLFTLLVIPGAIVKMEVAWYLADILNGLMVIPNLIALIGLSGVIVTETNLFLSRDLSKE